MRISYWSSDVCSSDLTADHEMTIGTVGMPAFRCRQQMPDGRWDDDALRIRIAVPPALWINPHARISAKQGVRTGIERPALRPDRRQIGGEQIGRASGGERV